MDRNPIEELIRQQEKSEKTAGNGGVSILLGVVFMVMGVAFMLASPGFGFIWIMLGLFLVVFGVQAQKLKKQREQKAAAMQARREPQYQSAQPKPQQAVKAAHCDNTEEHRHFDPAPYDAVQRRRDSMRHLYEAGLLTREEYADYVRKQK